MRHTKAPSLMSAARRGGADDGRVVFTRELPIADLGVLVVEVVEGRVLGLRQEGGLAAARVHVAEGVGLSRAPVQSPAPAILDCGCA
jgi:hypothetical protein